MTKLETDAPTEDLEEFRARARAWLPEHLTRIGATDADDVVGARMATDGVDAADNLARGRTIQRILYEGGFAGITYPRDCGGQGLPVSYLQTFNREARDYDFSPLAAFGMTLGMVGPTIVDFGTPQQKEYWIPRMLRGEDLWVQFLSEPTGGSDLAGAMTKAEQDGDEFVINGSKVWTSLAEVGDMGTLVCRTNADVPKHRGLSVILVPVRSPGLSVQPLLLASGETGFCQEFFDDVRVPTENLLGALDDGWTVTSKLLVHERNSVGGASHYHQIPGAQRGGSRQTRGGGGEVERMARVMSQDGDLVQLATSTGHADDAHARQLVAEAHVLSTVGAQLEPRVGVGTQKGVLPTSSGSLLKLFNSMAGIRRADIGMELAGSTAVVWRPDDDASRDRGVGYLFRQATSILSGTSEIQRNIISERILDLPRETAPDRDLPFNQVRHNAMPSRR
jgi:alkylation response protein AidB-like acyl-CoA dehydrogenase